MNWPTHYTRTSWNDWRLISDPGELPVVLKEIPLCKCHNNRMRWYNDRSKKWGGSFRCPIKRAASQRRYNERRYSSNQIYRTGDVIRKRRKYRTDSIESHEEYLRFLRNYREKELDETANRI